MKTRPTDNPQLIHGKSQQDLDDGFRAFQASLKREYKKVKGREYQTEPEREIGFHAHMKQTR